MTIFIYFSTFIYLLYIYLFIYLYWVQLILFPCDYLPIIPGMSRSQSRAFMRLLCSGMTFQNKKASDMSTISKCILSHDIKKNTLSGQLPKLTGYLSVVIWVNIHLELLVYTEVTPEHATRSQMGHKGTALLLMQPRRSTPSPGHFTPARREEYRRFDGPQSRSGRVRKISTAPRTDPQTVWPVARRYTDWAIRDHRRVQWLIYFQLHYNYNFSDWES